MSTTVRAEMSEIRSMHLRVAAAEARAVAAEADLAMVLRRLMDTGAVVVDLMRQREDLRVQVANLRELVMTPPGMVLGCAPNRPARPVPRGA